MMKKTVLRSLSLVLALILLMSSPILSAGASDNSYLNNPHFIKITADQARNKYQNGDRFMLYCYRTTCLNSQTIGSGVISLIMNTYGQDIYGLDIDAYGAPSFVCSYFSGTITLPMFLCLEGGTAVYYLQKGSASINEASSNIYNTFKLFCPDCVAREITSISVASMPTKTQYALGQSFDSAGLTIRVNYSNGTNEVITSGFTCSGFSSTTPGTVPVTVSYQGKSTSFNVTITAPTYALTYNANGGSGAPASQSGYGTITLSTAKPTRSGYVFRNWNTKANGTGVSYNPGASFSLTANTTLYAQWKLSDPATEPSISVGKTSGAPGDTVTLDVSFLNNPGINTYTLSFVYDTSALQLLSVTPNASLGGSFNYSSRASWINSSDTTYSGVFLTLTFKIKDTATKDKEYPVTVSYSAGDICNYDEDDVDFVIVAGSITVSPYIPGDINGDGVVNNKDLTRLLKYLSGENVTVVERALDVNGDSNVNNKDLTRLLKYLSGENVVIY